mmetsp:Transcript_26473/g.48611  ORF Transcript_26473/g.48611 Transcript_26473/m.48611 type:complete len:93 (+) Transcript_26473:630-908(+)
MIPFQILTKKNEEEENKRVDLTKGEQIIAVADNKNATVTLGEKEIGSVKEVEKEVMINKEEEEEEEETKKEETKPLKEVDDEKEETREMWTR